MSDRNASTSLSPLPAAASAREHLSTKRHTTRRRLRHAWLVGVAAALAACGGRHADSYQHATTAQETCCEHLRGPARDQCLAEIVRVSDPATVDTDTNRETFGCVEDHFVCDPATGRATQASAQDQYDCIVTLNDGL